MASSSLLCIATTILLSVSCLAEIVSLRGALRDRIVSLSAKTAQSEPADQYRFLPPVPAINGEQDEGLQLMDICVLASVDGNLHALNRTSGQMLWSMKSSGIPLLSPSPLQPLVRTQHADLDYLAEDGHDMYIVEPQSGDIFLMSAPDAPLQPFPFSMPQLVDMSPFSFSDGEDRRVFVGKKETSLLTIELETGRLKGTVNSECPWDPFESEDKLRAELDLDELDGTKPSKSGSTEILIGRTDYHIAIHSKPVSPNAPKPPVQNLVFSVYGPNNQDHAFQSDYRRSPDDRYIQPMANGEVISFRTSILNSKDTESESNIKSQLLWSQSFSNPVVAVFDIFRSRSRHNPLVLLQPRPRIQDVLPGANFELLSMQSTYVGIVDGTGSLFAMSPDHFPLVVFHASTSTSVDAITRARRERERCEGQGGVDRRCYTGMRIVEQSGPSRFARLIDGAPIIPSKPNEAKKKKESSSQVLSTGKPHQDKDAETNVSRKRLSIGPGEHDAEEKPYSRLIFPISSAVTTFALIFLGFWYVSRKSEIKSSALSPHTNTTDPVLVPTAHIPTLIEVIGNGHTSPLPTSESSIPGDPQPTAPEPIVETPLVAPTPDTPPTPTLPAAIDPVDDGDEEADSDKEETNMSPKKKGPKRRKRGKKGKGKDATLLLEEGPTAPIVPGLGVGMEEPGSSVIPILMPHTPMAKITSPAPSPSTLSITDEVLGFGSHGTVVYRGSLQGRAVAVKRLLRDFVTLAMREVTILQESDDHPNVIRYYYQEAHESFLYIALELCPASLADVIERPDVPLNREISNAFDPKRALKEITSGLRHLHALKIIHRDIKPHNILISAAKRGHRMLISDFGLCKKLEIDQTSFLPTANGATGTVGWRAPEILRGEVNIDEFAVDEASTSSRSSTGTVVNGSPSIPSRGMRLTKSVDIFALGCLFYYVMTNGSHPFGDRFEREGNIIKDDKDLRGLEHFGEEGLEAIDLIKSMVASDPTERPDSTACLLHPFFWTPARRLTFLQDASDRFEIMCRDPREPDLIELEKGAIRIVGNDWHSRLDKVFIENLGKFRKYDGKSVQDLMRALRNKKHHYQDLPENVKRHLGPIPDGFLSYFTRRFPLLFMHVHGVVSRSHLRREPMFRTYFEMTD